MRNILIIIAIILTSCKTDKKVENSSNSNELIIKENKKKFKIHESSELDSIWFRNTFNETQLTSENGQFYQGLKSKIYLEKSQSYENLIFNTYTKKVELPDGELSEYFVALISNSTNNLLDLKWIGNKGQNS